MILALAAAAAISASCPWDAPRGLRPLTEPFATVINRFDEIPADVRQKLIADAAANRFVDVATIKRGSIKGVSGAEYADLRMMHFAGGLLCRKVDLSKWRDDEAEPGMIYRAVGADGKTYTLIRPNVCNNWSMVTMTKPPPKGEPPHSVVIPPIEAPGGLDVPLPEQRIPLAFITPPPVTFQPLDMTAEVEFVEADPRKITADQGWLEWRQWMPLFGPVPQRSFVPVGEQLLPQPVFPPVPGITPVISLPSASPIAPGPAAPVSGLPGGTSDAVAPPVPEPGTWALMLGGLLGVWLMVRMRTS